MGGSSTRRAQSTVLGAILVFAILVALLGIFQVYVVPNQNADAELAHQGVIEKDFARFYAGVMNAAAENSEYTASFQLGMEYPARLISVNPPNPQGTLTVSSIGTYDTDAADVDGDGDVETLADICGISDNPEVNSLRYTPDYNEVRNAPVNAYENSISYRAVGDDAFVEYDQQLISGNVLRFRPLVSDSISTSQVGSATIDFYAGATEDEFVPVGTTITVPTELGEGQWEEIDSNNGDVSVDYNDGSDTVDLELNDNFTLQCTPIGLNQRPEQDESTGDEGPGEGQYTNPVGEDALELESVNGNNNPTLEFYSNDEWHNVTAIRVAASNSPGSGETVTLERNGDQHQLTINGNFTTVDKDDWRWAPDSYGDTVDVVSSSLPNSSQTEITLQFVLENGTILTYQFEI